MSSSLKCLDKNTGLNKCPDQKNVSKVYCDTRTGKCYTSTKSGQPHGFKKQQELAIEKGEVLIYDENYKLFGYGSDIDKHKKAFRKHVEKEITVEVLQSLSLQQLKEIAKEIDPEWNVSSYTNHKTLISAIIRRKREKDRIAIEREMEDIEEIEEIEESPASTRYKQDEFDKYDIWTNELNKKTNPRLVEYVPRDLKLLNESILNDLRIIWR